MSDLEGARERCIDCDLIDAMANAIWPLDHLTTDEARDELRRDVERALNVALPELARLRAEVERLRAETLRQGKRITEQDALLIAPEKEVERLKAKIGEADELLGPWGGTPAGTVGAVHNLIAENEQLRAALAGSTSHEAK